MAQFRFLVKLDSSIGHAMAATDAPVGRMALRFAPLLPHTTAALGFGAVGGQDWFLAESSSEFDPAAAWDECHRQLATGQGFAASPGTIYAEPDWPQTWVTEDRTEVMSPFAANVSCAEEEKWKDGVPHGNKFDWHADDQFTGLRSARNAVTVGSRRVRIGHLDTGYDPQHTFLPEKLNLALQRNFVDGENPANAADPYNTGILKAPGHGTGTVSILAGRKPQNPQFPDQDIGDYLGGAPLAEIVPVRIAASVVLFYTSAFAKGLDYLSGNTALCDVVTMSMGGLASGAWTEVVNRAYDLGVCIFAAAGNNFGGVPTHNIVYPARYKRVTAVCGVMADSKPYYNLPIKVMQGNYGPDSKMATALATYTPNVPWAKWGCGRAFRPNGEGTSAATPQAAAAAALYIQNYLAEIGAYDQPWKKVEGVRKALFDSASKNTFGDWKKFFGNGILNARAALALVPSQTLTKMPPDSASFPFLRIITGLGIAATSNDMLKLEIVQLAQLDPEVEKTLPDPEATDWTPENKGEVLGFFDTVLQSSKASATLKNALKERLAGDLVVVPADLASPAPGAPVQPSTTAPAAVAAAMAGPVREAYSLPPYRKLRGYSVDPSLATQLSNVGISETTYQIRWESNLKPGPTGEYIEVSDLDYAEGGVKNAPVDVNSPHLLAQDGLPPSEGNMQFHQQMVYAVAMQTIEHFEAALGRRALWAAESKDSYVPRLTLHPHALHEQNAYYSPDRKAVLFGYFPATSVAPGLVYPGGMVYACLSHDIVAHEVTHALLDGIHRGFRQATNPDVFAFHEAFADIVALFQHFSNTMVLRNELAQVRGNLELENKLSQLAIQFGTAITGHGALRDAIGDSSKGYWQRLKEDPSAYGTVVEAHRRGSVLVAAVFRAFLNIYHTRTADLVRIATGGTGVLPSGALHPDLVNRLVQEARTAAGHVLNMCIRALDYCPPVDITFGDYLRALITADFDLVPDDDLNYRVAFIEAFRQWGLYPRNLTTLSEETLLWRPPEQNIADTLRPVFDMLRDFAAQHTAFASREETFRLSWECKDSLKDRLKEVMKNPSAYLSLTNAFGLSPHQHFTIEALRLARRVGPDGNLNSQLIAAITQNSADGEATLFAGGCTVIADLNAGAVRYCITKNIQSQGRQQRTMDYRSNAPANSLLRAKEPFALLHLDSSHAAAPSNETEKTKGAVMINVFR